ncbi:MAG: hypothetical protein ACI8ZM_004265 [Crocinitomix sp.]|jgi:hypothetical protein
MKFFLVPIYFILTLTSTFGQKNLDDNKPKSIEIIFGTDVLTGWGGTPNIYAEVHFMEKVGVQFGYGLTTFTYLADIANLFVIFEPKTAVVRNIDFGTFYNFGFRYLTEDIWRNYTRYFYFDFKRWNYQLNGVDDKDYFRRKGSFGAGRLYSPNDKLGIDAHMGLFLGKDWHEKEAGGQKLGDKILSGFDLGLTLFYKL